MLHTLAQQHVCTLKGSTSSVSGVLSHIYFALSNFKRVRTKLLSSHFKVMIDACAVSPHTARVSVLTSFVWLTYLQDQPDNFTLATKLPCVVVRPNPLLSLTNCNIFHMFFVLATESTAATRTTLPPNSTLRASGRTRS